jgi:hypothetical protein
MAWPIPASSRNKATGIVEKCPGQGLAAKIVGPGGDVPGVAEESGRAPRLAGSVGIGGCKLVILLSRIGRRLFRPPRRGTTSLLLWRIFQPAGEKFGGRL